MKRGEGRVSNQSGRPVTKGPGDYQQLGFEGRDWQSDPRGKI